MPPRCRFGPPAAWTPPWPVPGSSDAAVPRCGLRDRTRCCGLPPPMSTSCARRTRSPTTGEHEQNSRTRLASATAPPAAGDSGRRMWRRPGRNWRRRRPDASRPRAISTAPRSLSRRRWCRAREAAGPGACHPGCPGSRDEVLAVRPTIQRWSRRPTRSTRHGVGSTAPRPAPAESRRTASVGPPYYSGEVLLTIRCSTAASPIPSPRGAKQELQQRRLELDGHRQSVRQDALTAWQALMRHAAARRLSGTGRRRRAPRPRA